MSGLRAELLGETLPDFTLALPPGWARHGVDERTRDEMLRDAKRRLMAAHRPDLFGQLNALTTQAFQQLESLETVAFFTPGPETPEEWFLPVTLTASVRRGPDGATLDDTIAHVIRSSGATPLGDDKRFVRWQTTERRDVDGTGLDATTVAYLTPVPGTGRRRAIQLTLVITHDRSAPGDEEWLVRILATFDLFVSTFGWVAE